MNKAEQLNESFDVYLFVQHYKLATKFFTPFILAFKFTKNLIDDPKWAACISLTSLLVSFLPNSFLLSLFQIWLLLLVCVGAFQQKFKVFKKIFPDYGCQVEDVQPKNGQNISDTLAEFRSCLVQIDQLLITFCSSLRFCCSILKWDDPSLSFRLTLSVSMFSICHFYVGFNLTVFLMLTTYFSHSQYQACSNVDRPIEKDCLDSSGKDDPCKSEFRLAHTDIECNMEIEGLLNNEALPEKKVIKDEGSTSAEGIGVDYTDNSSKIAKGLSKLRKLHIKQQETCSSCHAHSSSFLRRSHTCVNCAQNFCHKCCTLKVPKSVLGVTAPNTCNDLVFICFACHQSFYSD